MVRRQLWRRCALAAAALVAAVVAVLVVRARRADEPRAPAPAMPTARPAVPEPAIAIAPRPVVTVRVTVDGAPASDALVAITDGSKPVLAQAWTDRDGRVRFDELPPGPYEVWASADARASAPLRIEQAGELELALAPAANVRGEIDADGLVPPGSKVTLVPLDGDHAARIAEVDAAGRFTVAGVPLGRWRIDTDVPGHASANEPALKISAREAEVVVRVVRTGAVSGTVVDADGAPVANATIVLRDQSGATPQRPLSLVETGLRWVHPLAGTRWMPVWESARFAASRPGTRPTECGRGHCGIDIGNQRGSIVHAAADGEIATIFAESRSEAGKVVAIHHGGGLKTFYMHLDEIRPGLEVGQPIRAGDPVGTLGSTGFTRNASAPHVHFAITHEQRGRTWYLDPEPALRHAVVLPAPRPYEPFEPGPKQPLAGQPVVERVTTDARGRFHVEGIAPGTYVAGVFAADHAPGASSAFAVASGETAEIRVQLDAGIAVRGVVLGRDGPLPGAIVMAGAGFGETAHKIATTYTDKAGRFTLRALGGKVTLSVQAPSYSETERTLVVDARTREQVFQLAIENARLRGQVLAPDGGAAPGVTVRVISGPTRKRTVTDAQGQFALAVAAGEYTIELSSPDYPSKRIELVPERWREVRLDAGGGMRVLVRDAHAGAPIATRVELAGPSGQKLVKQIDARGGLELRGLVPGDWRVTARAAGFTPATRTIEIRAGRVLQDVVLELARSARIAGTVRDRHGRRVAGARVTIGDAATKTDTDGNFTIADAPVGSHVVEAELDGMRGTLAVELSAGAERTALTIELQ